LVESGSLPASKEFLRRVSEALSYPPSFFGQSLAYRNLPVTFFRKKSRVAQRKLVQIQATLNIVRFRVSLLLKSVNFPPVRIPAVAVGDRVDRASLYARELRIAWHLRPGPIADLTKVVEAAGVIVFPVDFETDKVDGISLYEPNDATPPIIFVRRSAPADRVRWTIAHELAHIIFHHHQTIPDDNSEAAADAFASEFLMPETDIRGQLSADLDMRKLASLKLHWRVSMASILMKAAAIKKISEERSRSLWIQMAKYGYRKKEPVSIDGETPLLLSELVETHLNDLGFTEHRLRDDLFADGKDFSLFHTKRGGLYAVG
jgi:Zn-dependent peptidase ImmA (M78 family)